MPYEFGDVVLAPFPFTNQAALKRRPAVVVSSRAYNAAKPDVIIMAITSQIHATSSLGEVWIVDWQLANLLKPSAIKPVFATLEQNLIVRHLGALHAPDQSALRAAIAAVLG
jgi:mRNA interferase MazF